jgi:hypothetical protein
MKGVVFNVVEEVITERFGADTWDDLLESADLEGAYTALGNYDDVELVAIVNAAAEALDVQAADVLRLVGRHGFAHLADRYPEFRGKYTTSRMLLAELNDVIHPQVLSLYPGASVPEFDFAERGAHVVLTYRSPRGLCHLAEGLALGAAAVFDEKVTVEQQTCRHRGDTTCRVVVDYQVDD